MENNMEQINNTHQKEEVRTRAILGREIDEKLPINYDVLQELVEKAQQLFFCMLQPTHRKYTLDMDTYVNCEVSENVIHKFSYSIVLTLLCGCTMKEFTAEFLSSRIVFKCIFEGDDARHVYSLNSSDDPVKAWELFNRIEYLINNFETEILLSDMEMKNE
nr:MAG TPA: hypothetical protein [Caudoviricetes sp.]